MRLNAYDLDLVLPSDQLPTREEIDVYCVHDDRWQDFRRSLKGLDTWKKLGRLVGWLLGETVEGRSREAAVQVHNYIGALKRGGQLSADGWVQR